jgi:hypothetical protein
MMAPKPRLFSRSLSILPPKNQFRTRCSGEGVGSSLVVEGGVVEVAGTAPSELQRAINRNLHLWVKKVEACRPCATRALVRNLAGPTDELRIRSPNTAQTDGSADGEREYISEMSLLFSREQVSSGQ